MTGQVASLATLDRPKKTVRELIARGPLRVDVDYGFQGQTRWALCYGANEPWPYQSTYLSVVTDTAFSDGRSSFVTEKVMKPLANLYPFIFIGDPGALAELRSHGYRTFSPWIDERYDEILDPRARMTAILAEVERLATMPLSVLHELYCDCWPILVHNYGTFMDAAPRMAERIVANLEGVIRLN